MKSILNSDMDKSYRTEHWEYKENLIKKLIEVLKTEIDDYGRTYEEFESYLWEVFEKNENLYSGLINALETYLEK